MKPIVLSGLSFSLLFAMSAGPARADAETGVAAFSHGNFEVARQELTSSARDGHAGAQYYLGRIYAGGHGVPRDLKRAVDLYIGAAEQGHALAQYDLAYAQFMGEGTDQDLVEALKWFILAGRGGVEKSGALAKRVMDILPRDMVHEARTEALAWINEHGVREPDKN